MTRPPAAPNHATHTPPDLHLDCAAGEPLRNRFDVKWVMGQVGHADSKMTMDVYAHLQQRLKREHGVCFDRLIPEAEELMHSEGLNDVEEAEAEPAEAASDHDEGD
jgi:hypothetical protein